MAVSQDDFRLAVTAELTQLGGREFAKCPVLYLNEPPLECEASCGWGPMEVDESTGQLLHQRIYTLREVEPGDRHPRAHAPSSQCC